MKTKKLNLIQKTAALCLALLLIIASLPLISGMFAANAYETSTFKDFQPYSLGLENPQFSNYSGGFPASPSGWTETNYPNKNKGATAMGVLDLDNYNTEETRKAAKLTEYPEYKSAVPISPFGKRGVVAAEDGTDKILMINTTEDTETVIGYQSSNLTLGASKYFRISAWVKTGDFYGQYGAAIRLNGFTDRSVAFSNIRTASSKTELTEENIFGWEQYTFYIQTSSTRSESVNLALTVGDYYRGKNIIGNTDANSGEVIINQNAKGYAFFGNIEAVEISPTAYNIASLYRETNPDVYGDNVQFIELPLPGADPQTGEKTADGKQTDYLSFTPAGGQDGELNNYSITTAKGAGIASSDLVYPAVFNTELSFSAQNNAYGLKNAPIHPTGKYSGNSYVMALSSYRGKSGNNSIYKETAVGYKSQEISIKKFQYYRLSVWVNTQDISGGAGATLVVETSRQSRENPKENITFRATGCSGDPANGASYGFTEYAFYIKGSIYQDYTVTLGLWLGQEDNFTKGIAMFANPKFEKLTPDQYNESAGNSAGGTPVDIDVSRTDTGITNGNFDNYIESNETDKLPSVANWTAGVPLVEKTADDVIYGAMITDATHWQTNKTLYGTGAFNPLNESGCVLYMASPSKNAISYSSPVTTLEEAATYELKVSLRIDNVTGYGASLVLKDDNGTIATIENITDTSRRFHDYTFYVQSDGAARNLTLEIWLGMADREGSSRKHSDGNLYVNTVSLQTIEPESFTNVQSAYKRALNNWNIVDMDYAVFSYSEMNFTEYDPYGTNFVKYPYLWSVSGPSAASPVTVRSGIFDSANIPVGIGDIPSHFKNPDRMDEDGNLTNNNVLMLSNGAKTSSRLTLDRAYNLTAQMYYRLEVSMKVDIHQDSETSIGAGIELAGTDFKFENISSTIDPSDPTNTEKFKTFFFYIYAGEDAQSFQLSITLGGQNASEFCSGYVYVNSVNFVEISNTEFDEETGKIKRDTNNIMKVEFKVPENAEDENSAQPEENGHTTTDNWALVPSILFAVALLLALGWVVARKLGENIKARRIKSGAGVAKGETGDYDRKKTVEKGFTLDSTATEETFSDEQKLYEEFDDTATVANKSDKERKLEERKATIESATEVEASESETEAEENEEQPKEKENDFIDSFED